MAGAMVSASTGAVNSLLGKLATLMGEEYGKLKGVRKEVGSLEDEFRSMKALLERLSDMDELDPQAKEWRNQVKDMSYDIEDCVDDFMHHLGKHNNNATTGFLKKTARLLKKLRTRHQIASKIQDIKVRVKEVSERRMRYKLDEYYTPESSYVSVDPRVVAIYKEANGLVGIDGPRDELVKLLMYEEKDLKVAAIVGFGGLGKTTLASEVRRKIQGQFDCRAMVSVSQIPDIPKLLGNILQQIGGQCSSHISELNDLSSIREHLLDKRYLIIIDDLWDSSAWDFIRSAFPENSHGSRILITTRIYSVAIACCSRCKEYVYQMKYLDYNDSRGLFFGRIFGFQEPCPDTFIEVSADILKKCGGLPLAIISIASLLTDQPKTKWEYVRSSLGSMFEGNSSLKDMERILDLSYRNLPHHLKTCLLYLAMYPEDYIIQKNDLLMQWIAEGFVISKVRGLDAEDVAANYFNELINMSMIQPVDTDYNDEVLSCRVHDLMLDLIKVKSADENFIDVIHEPQATKGLHKKTRRVSLHYNGAGGGVLPMTVNGSVSQVRSVMASTTDSLPSFLGFKHIRVMSLQFRSSQAKMDYTSCKICNTQTQKIDLTGMCGLFLLRYLKISSNTVLELPRELWGLQYLETMVLHVKKGTISVPSDVNRLRRLLHLIVPSGIEFSDQIGSLKSLRTLGAFDASGSSLDSILSLGELTNLRELQVLCSSYPVTHVVEEALRSSLERLSCSSSLNLKKIILSVPRFPSTLFGHEWSILSRFSAHLQSLDLKGMLFSGIPKWIGQLRGLHELKLCVREVVPKEDDIGILAGLPSLVHLSLLVQQHSKQRITIAGHGVKFPALKSLEFSCSKAALPVFEEGAMPKLHKFVLGMLNPGSGDLTKWELRASSDMGHLPAGVKEIKIDISFSWFLRQSISWWDAEPVKSALRSVFSRHHPGVHLIFG